MIQIAWLWLRHQPQSALTVWFRERIKRTGGRLGKTMIVALARKLLVALWKYATAGVLIEGAVLLPPIYRGLISPGGSRWANRTPRWLGKADLKNGLVLLSPHPTQAGCWCSCPAQRPNVSLTWCRSRARSCKGLRPWIPNSHPRKHHDAVTHELDSEMPM